MLSLSVIKLQPRVQFSGDDHPLNQPPFSFQSEIKVIRTRPAREDVGLALQRILDKVSIKITKKN